MAMAVGVLFSNCNEGRQEVAGVAVASEKVVMLLLSLPSAMAFFGYRIAVTLFNLSGKQNGQDE